MVTGADSSVRYKREKWPTSGLYSDHDLTGDSTFKVFGHDLRMSTSFRNGVKKGLGLGSRQGTRMDATVFEPMASLEFTLSNPWWLRLFFGATPVDNGAGPYSHYFLDTANENGAGALALSKTIPAFTIENDINTATPSDRLLQGCFLDGFNISAAVGGMAEVRLSAPFRTVTKSTGAVAAQVADSYSAYTFAYGNVYLPTGGVLANIQNVSLDVSNKVAPGLGLGSRFKTRFDATTLDIGMTSSMYFLQDSDVFDKFLGSTTVPTTPATTTIDLVFDNGQAGTAQRQISFKFTGVVIDEYTLAQAVENPLIDEWKPEIQQMTLCKAIDNTAVSI